MAIGEITISAAITWIIAVAAAITTIFKALEVLKGFSKKADYAGKLARHDELFDKDNRRIARLEEAIEEQQKAQAVLFRAILSQINHALTGNGNDRLKDARDEIQNYLASR